MVRSSPLDQQAIKRQNRRLILEALQRQGPLSRAELAREVGLTKSTVSALVQEMLEEGLLGEGRLHNPGLGRPGTRLEFRSENALALGVDLGVDDTQVIVLDLNRQIQAVWEWVESPSTSLSERLFKLARQVQNQLPHYPRLLGIGLAIPGVVKQQELLYAPGLGWRKERPAETLSNLLHLPVALENNANAAALGETFWGENHSPLLFIMLTTGLGTGLVVEEQVYRGRHGAAGELGHWLLGSQPRHHPPSVVEHQLSLRAIVGHYQSQSGRSEGFRGLLEHASRGDRPALEALEELAYRLGCFIANAAVAYDPAVVVLGGPGAEAWPWLEAPLRAALKEQAFIPEHAELPIRPSAFGHLAPAMGAAALVLQRFLANGGTRDWSPPISTLGTRPTIGGSKSRRKRYA
ncbi:ROK family transcriptional regulator [Meiothermus rufus]|uniref:ROK family transcriptional regulator n=1 Tax=Meiothermus rufus TaxID=604332 RepID=UPI0004236391|nr:ROK family transcriptional regulator [Meiothermus rufus]